MVFCHSCEIYRIWTSRSKEERCRENALKSSTGGGGGGRQCKPKEGGSLYREGRISLCNTALLKLSLIGYCRGF